MSKPDAIPSKELPDNDTRNSRPLRTVMLDWIFLYCATAAAIFLALRAIYVFLTGNWTLAEGLAALAKLLGIVAITYLVQTRYISKR